MKNKLLFNLLLLPILMFMGTSAIAQISVSGTVTDANGPVPGVNVIVKETSNGAQTDFDGNYTLDNVDEDAVLIFSYIGYATQEVAVSGRTVVDVNLSEDVEALNEVVVIGYGTTTVKDATGSVSAVTSENFVQGVISSPEQLIQGKTAGVQITETSGQPGAPVNFRIRGSNSIRSNNNPLFVIDGVPVSGGSTAPSTGDIIDGQGTSFNPLSFLNPNDIESISILKDASATAIYGSRGANGVVIVTTRSGRGAQGGRWEFSSNLSISKAQNRYDLLDANTFLDRLAEVTGDANAEAQDFGANTDWQDFLFRTSASQNQNLAYSNNYGTGNVRATFGYGKQFGVIEKSDLERITGRVNWNQRFFDDRLQVAVQSSISRVNNQSPPISGTAGFRGNILGAVYSANPTYPDDPNFNPGGTLLNPANYLENFEANTRTERYLVNFSPTYNITDEIAAKVTLGYDKSYGESFAVLSGNVNNFDRIPGNGQGAFNTLNSESKLLEATLNYKKQFDNSNLDVVVGYSFQDFTNQGFNSQGFGFGTTDLNQMQENLEEGVRSLRGVIQGDYQQAGYDFDSSFITRLFPEPMSEDNIPSQFIRNTQSLWIDTFDNTDELQSFFGRVNYDIADKYLFTATFRADGSSRFGPNEKTGYFPSGAFAWKISEEDFMGDAFSTLKLRVGVGLTGNQEGLGYGSYVRRQRFAQPGIQNDGTIQLPGTIFVALDNPDLQWEETLDYNFGVDFGFNNDRFSGSLDLYRKETRDLLFRSAAAAPADDPFRFVNLENGVVINQGVELALNFDIIETDDVSFNTSFNIAYNHNEVQDLQGLTTDLAPVNGPGLTGSFVQRLGEGRSLFSYYMAVYEGEDADGNPILNADDKQFVGEDALPDVTTGLSLNLRVKNWDFSTSFTGQFGFSVYNNTANAFFNVPALATSRNITTEGLNNLSSEVSTLYLEKGDFVRMQAATIGYNVPIRQDGALKTLRLSASGQNLFLITDYSGLDPEITVNTGDIGGNGFPSQGVDYTAFPRPRTVTLGLNATF